MKVVAVGMGESNWDVFVRSTHEATSYHQLGWRRVVTRSFGHQCHYLAAIDELGEWQGILPLVHMHSRMFGNFLVSVPFANYGGLLCKSEVAARFLLEEAEQIRHACKSTYIELRHVARALEGVPTREHKVTMMLELARDGEGQWNAFNAKLRNQIRKAEKLGLRTATGHLNLLDTFYDVFARNMRDLGTPVYPRGFFYNILEEFANTTKIFVVYHGDIAIAAGICLWFKDTMEMPWASSISDYRSLCPNNMLYWNVIRFAIERRFRKFDFGRSTPYEGTYNFKKQWGARPVPLSWQYLMDESAKMPELNPSNPRYRAAIRAWQRLPVPISKMLGPMIVRNIP